MILSQVKLLKKKFLVGRRRKIVLRTIKEPPRKWFVSNVIEKLNLIEITFITRKELFERSDKYKVFQFGSEESIVVTEPHNSGSTGKLPWSIESTIGTFTLEKPFVAEVPNAELVGPAVVGFDEDGSLISETIIGGRILGSTSDFLSKLPIRTLISQNVPSFGTPQLDTVFSLATRWSNGYYHWLTDLTRLEGAEYYQQQTGRKPTLIIDANPGEWKLESLRLLGYEPDDCIRWNGSRLKAKRLVVPAFRSEDIITSPAACRWLRQRMLSNLPDIGSNKLSFASRIYIIRTKKVGRNVLNEDEVLEALAPFGFVAYTLENMSFSDKVRLFSQAEIVVAPHGAGLVNTMFAPQNLIIIDLFGSYGTPCFLTLAKALGFHYGCLGSAGDDGKINNEEMYGDLIVDIPKLRDLVAEMLDIYGDRKLVSTAY